jgi:hypothetical protein
MFCMGFDEWNAVWEKKKNEQKKMDFVFMGGK